MKSISYVLVLVLTLLKASTSRVVNKESCDTAKCNPYERPNGFASAASKWDVHQFTYPVPRVVAQPIDALDFLTQDLNESSKDQFRMILQGLQGSPEGTWVSKLVRWDSVPGYQAQQASDQIPLAMFELKTTLAVGSLKTPLKKISLEYYVFGDGASIEVTSGSLHLANLTKSLKSDWDFWTSDFGGEEVMEVQVTLKSADKNSFILINSLEAEVDCSAYAEEGDCEYATTPATSPPPTPSTISTSSPSDATTSISSTTEGLPTSTSTSSSSSAPEPTQAPITSTTMGDDCTLTRTLDSNEESWIQTSTGSLQYFSSSAELASADALPGGLDIYLSKLEATGVWLQLPLGSPQEAPVHFQLEDSVGIKSVSVRYFALGDAKIKIMASQQGRGGSLSTEEQRVHKKSTEESSLWQEASVYFEDLGATEVKIYLEVSSPTAALLMDSITATVPCRSGSGGSTTTFATSKSTEQVSSTTDAEATSTNSAPTDPTATCRPIRSIDILAEASASAWSIEPKTTLQYFNHTEQLKNAWLFPKEIDIDALNAEGVWMQRSSAVIDTALAYFLLKEPSGVLSVTVRYFSFGNTSLKIETVGGKNDSSVDNAGPLDSKVWRQMRMDFDNVVQVKVMPSVTTESSVILIDYIAAEVSCTSEEVPMSSTQLHSEVPSKSLGSLLKEPAENELLTLHQAISDMFPDPRATCRPKRSINTEAEAEDSSWSIVPLSNPLKYFNYSEDLKKLTYFPTEIDIEALDAEGVWMQRTSATTDSALPYFILKEPNGVVNVTVRYFSYANGSVVIEAFGSKNQKALEEKMPTDSSPWRYLSMQLDDHVSQIKVIPKVATESSVIMIDSITAFANCGPPTTTVLPEDPSTDASTSNSVSIFNFSFGIFVLFLTSLYF